jgi:two-component system chemotaxis sensor kinase CheA
MKYKILCIDDEQENLDVYKMMLEEEYTVLTALTYQEAFSILKKHHAEIIYVFSDFNMPEKSGLEVRQEMLSSGYEIPFVIVTGRYDLEMATKAMELRIASFLKKPFKFNDLKTLISDLGEKRIVQISEEKEMVCSFISESSPMLEEIEGLILILEENPGDINTINTYARLLHTIKGTASCVGLKSLPAFVHSYEDLVSLAKERKIAVTSKVVDSLLFGLDRLKFMYEAITTGGNSEFDIKDWVLQINSYKSEEQETELSVAAASTDESHENKKVQSEKLAIPLETLDSFLELSGKLTIARNTIYKAISRVEVKFENDKDIEKLSTSIEELHKITSFLQKQITDMRKVGAESITRPLKRVVRDMSKELVKDIELVVHNENIKVDNTIAKVMSNCLVHLIRNSIDHGLENPETRKKLKKKSLGTIDLTLLEDGEKNIVILKDDGAGINKKRVLEKAIEKNLVTSDEAKYLSDSDIFSLIFASGFSTAQTVSSISGRGVGMDMVKSSIEAIGGKILIDSSEGLGTTFTLNLPLPKSVLINQTLMIEENMEAYSIPIDDVVEIVCLRKEDFAGAIFNVASCPVLKRYDEIIPVLKLQNCLRQIGHQPLDLASMEDLLAIIVKNGAGKMGIIVEKIHEIEESVIRKVSPVMKTSAIYSGVTYFGDDNLALVLNIESIASENFSTISQISKENIKKSIKMDVVAKNNLELELFTFLLGNEHYGIATNKVFRIETIKTGDIHEFKNNYFINYNGNIVKVISLDSEGIKNIRENELAAVIMIKDEVNCYALYIDDFFEFITSDYQMESYFSKNKSIKGSIVYQDRIVYVVDDAWLDVFAKKSETDAATLENSTSMLEKIAA